MAGEEKHCFTGFENSWKENQVPSCGGKMIARDYWDLGTRRALRALSTIEAAYLPDEVAQEMLSEIRSLIREDETL